MSPVYTFFGKSDGTLINQCEFGDETPPKQCEFGDETPSKQCEFGDEALMNCPLRTILYNNNVR